VAEEFDQEYVSVLEREREAFVAHGRKLLGDTGADPEAVTRGASVFILRANSHLQLIQLGGGRLHGRVRLKAIPMSP
jgi:hypothetical protein